MRHFAMPVRSWAVSAPRSIAAVAVLALGLTACGSDDEGASATGTPSASGSVTASAAGAAVEESPADGSAAEGSTTGGGKGEDSSNGGGGAAGAAAKAAPCLDSSLSLSVEHIEERTHELIMVRNKGDKACTVLNAPMISFDDLDNTAAVMANTRPRAVVTLDSGATAYAALVLDPEGTAETEGKAVKTFHVGLEGPQGGTLSGTLPGAPVKVYESEVTAWQQSMNDLATIGF